MDLNLEQEEAIRRIDENIVVNAGAGTGKTTVLVQRYLRILELGKTKENRELESIVAISFTKKAAQEMSQRVRQELARKIGEGPKWARYYRDLERATISTIHGFCANIIRENTIELGLDPKFQILDENVSNKILNKSLEELIVRETEGESRLIDLLKDLEIYRLDTIRDQLKAVYIKLRGYGFKLDQLKKDISLKIDGLELEEGVLEKIRDKTQFILGGSRKNSKIYKFSLEEDYERFRLGDFKDLGEVRTFMEKLKDNLGTSKEFQEDIDETKDLINKVLILGEKENLDFYILILDLMEKLDLIYSREKEKLAALDYEDLQLEVNRLLDSQEHRAYYQDKYRYLMVDEFQDTNEIQREIFYKLASKTSSLDRNNLFVVGDPKQSIYGFRGGDLNVFYRVVDDIKNLEEDNILKLDRNYRTNENIVDFINYLFGELMGEDYISLKPEQESKDSLEIQILAQEIDYKTNDQSLENRQHEAKLIAGKIQELVESGQYKYEDIAILFRSGNRTHIYEKELSNFGLPYYNVSNGNFFECQEIIDLSNGLRAFLNLDDLTSNIGFLRSPMLGLNDHYIYWFSQLEGNSFNRLKLLLEKEEDEILLEAVRIYQAIIDRLDSLNISQLLDKILEETDYKKLVLLLARPRQKYANIEKFQELILDFQLGQAKDNYHILDYLEELESRGLSQANIVSEDDNTIKIMTIHKSKGLEFPVVIIPELSLAVPVNKDKIIYEKHLGLAIARTKNLSFYQQVREALTQEEIQEMERVLYVGMTRAKKRLIIGNQGQEYRSPRKISQYFSPEHYGAMEGISFGQDKDLVINYLDQDLILDGNLEPASFLEYKDYDQRLMTSFNISQYLSFKACRRQFYLNSLMDLSQTSFQVENPDQDWLDKSEGPSGKISGLDRGNIVHKFCQLYRVDMEHGNLIRKITRDFGYDYESIKDHIDPYVNNFIKYTDDSFDKIYREEKFRIRLGDYSFTGVIDRINIRQDQVELVDYKTNKFGNRKYILNAYEEQILFYSHVVESVLGKKVSRASLFLLGQGKFIDVDLSQERIKETLVNMEAFADFVKEHRDLESYEKTLSCDENCRFYQLCQDEKYF